MSAAKVVSLSVRPFQVSHLCFEVGGILGEFFEVGGIPGKPKIGLGAPVAAFDFAASYATLSSFPTIAGDLSRLRFDPLEIQKFIKPFALAALRAEPGKAALNSAINARQNAYFAKYGNAQDIVDRLIHDYAADLSGNPLLSGDKTRRLGELSRLAQEQADELSRAYKADKRTGVVKTTNSNLDSTSKIHSRESSTRTGDRHVQSLDKSAQFLTTAATFPPPAPGAPGSTVTIGNSDNPVGEDFQEGSSSESSSDSDKSKSKGSATEHQTIVNTDYGYRIPFLECQAQNERAQISLLDESFAQFMFGQNLPNLAQVFINELNSIDSNVYRLQIAYLNSVLMSPISGIVTGIYKNPGDPVRAGEPVIRVEDNADILLVATLIFRGPISIGSNVTVKTTLFDVSGPPPTPVKGKVVAVRGQREDDQWEVIVKCHNPQDVDGKLTFPIGYHFDYDPKKTSISIT